MKYKWLIRIVYLIFIIFLLELCGYFLLRFYSKSNDYISNRNYDKIREMLRGDLSVSKYWQVANLNYIPNPNYKKGKLTHNSKGFRGIDVSVHRNGKYRILCIGGSTTYGTGVKDDKHTYPAFLQEILEEKYGMQVEVINAGLEAATSFEELSAYLFKYRYFKPDLVIIHSGGNDALAQANFPNRQLDNTDYRKINFYVPSLSKGKYLLKSQFLSFLIIHFWYGDAYKDRDLFQYSPGKDSYFAKWSDEITPTERILDTSYNSFYRNYLTLTNEILADSAQVIHLCFLYNPEKSKHMYAQKYIDNIERNNKLIKSVAKKTDTRVLDLSGKIPYQYFIDDCHLNEQGERQKAEWIAPVIELMRNRITR